MHRKGPSSIGLGLGSTFSVAREAGDKGVEAFVGGYFQVSQTAAVYAPTLTYSKHNALPCVPLTVLTGERAGTPSHLD